MSNYIYQMLPFCYGFAFFHFFLFFIFLLVLPSVYRIAPKKQLGRIVLLIVF